MTLTGDKFTIAYGPPVTDDRYTLYPETVEALAVQPRVTACEMTCTPFPERVIVAGDAAALLITVAAPVTLPAAAGAKVTFKITVFPGATICPEEMPLAANPAPEMLTPDTLTLEFPALVKVTPRTLLPPVVTLGKVRLFWLALRTNVAAPTLKIAALLVNVPAALATLTVNRVPSSEAVVAGVVYEFDVAPGIAIPFLFHWKASGAVPEAVTAKLAVCPAITF